MKALVSLAALAAAVAAASVAWAAGSAVPKLTVVAKNLNNPRQVWAMGDGSVYVAEAGKAGSQKVDKTTFRGFTSAIARWRPGGLQRVVKGLASIGGRDGTFTTGADGVSVDGSGAIYVAMTGAPCTLELPPDVKAQAGQILRVKGGKKESVADIESLECSAADVEHGVAARVDRDCVPAADGTDKNPNPYAVLALADGSLYVSNWSVLPGTPAKGGPFKGKTGELVRIRP